MPRTNEADRPAKAAARKQQLPPDVFFEEISTPSTRAKKESRINAIFSEDWRAPIMAYLWGHYEPSDKAEEKRLSQRARGYVISQDELYKSGVVTPWLKCIPVAQGVELLNEIHSSIYGFHIDIRPLATKAFRQGFFWPSALKDAQKVVKNCEACQKLGPKSNKPLEPLQLIAPAWPLQRWGMGLIGPLPTAQGNYKYAVVAVEYFTKWVEAKPMIKITSEAVRKFFWQNIICRFGVPKELTVNNGK
jgi:hypothetical protein